MNRLFDWLKCGKRPFILLLGLLAVIIALSLIPADDTSNQTAQEKRLCDVLSRIEGAGRVQAVLFYQSEAGGAWGSERSEVTGCVIVADGARDIGVKLSLIRAARTLLGLPESAVDVFAMEGSQ